MLKRARNPAVSLDSPPAERDFEHRTADVALSCRELHWLRELEKVVGQCPPPEVAESLIGVGYADHSRGRLGLTYTGKLYLKRTSR